MKKLILVFIFALQLDGMANVNTTKANGVFTEQSQESFQTFIKKQAPMFYQVDTDNWKTFQKVVTYYTNSKSNLLKMTEVEKRNFLVSADQVVKELSIMNSTHSDKWINKIVATTATIKFTWQVLEEKTDVEFEQAPKMIEQPKVDLNFIGK